MPTVTDSPISTPPTPCTVTDDHSSPHTQAQPTTTSSSMATPTPTTPTPRKLRVAVVGSGLAGLTVAHLLSSLHLEEGQGGQGIDVELFEKAHKLGKINNNNHSHSLSGERKTHPDPDTENSQQAHMSITSFRLSVFLTVRVVVLQTVFLFGQSCMDRIASNGATWTYTEQKQRSGRGCVRQYAFFLNSEGHLQHHHHYFDFLLYFNNVPQHDRCILIWPVSI